ncbi:MAG: tRNA (adenosine(37)-N6)-threonylcarbamoyltransferase complex transferase subunit TsaD [Mycoplasmataceae bacterium]|jgi:N6-L-threonylcarbamoyladenine synthase|nr:tRNA (adenosine(37)-N6)-threonylcarbamoyltransferase complex transferase subunit TsaD [Mycoplasmataceae bacterium]
MSNILAIETSCDDTSIALVKDDKIVSCADSSSIKEYSQYGGIVPELASRMHEQNIVKVFEECIKDTPIESITHIAYTSHPGLPGSLHVGKVFAKTVSFLLDKPLLAIDHMMGHAFSYAIDKKQIIKFPLLSLVISGGNTILYKFESLTEYTIINKTTDDAVGECLDKIGRALELPYPGGISLDKQYDSSKIIPTIPHLEYSRNFSFSGIKSFSHTLINKKNIDKIAIGSSCLEWCVDDIIIKLLGYSKQYNIKNIAIGGGVAANNLLTSKLKKIKEIDIHITEKKCCGDNGAMIGFYASLITNE